jgi:hypothetical protein
LPKGCWIAKNVSTRRDFWVGTLDTDRKKPLSFCLPLISTAGHLKVMKKSKGSNLMWCQNEKRFFLFLTSPTAKISTDLSDFSMN